LLTIFLLAPNCLAFQTESKPKQLEQPKILATVNGNEISENQVTRELGKSTRNLRLSKAQYKIAETATLERLINQHVVLEYLKSKNSGAGKNQIIEKLDELEAQLSAVDQKLSDYLSQNKMTQSELEFQFAWLIAWGKFSEQKLTDQALETHFNRNKRKFDGTELRVAHLLLKKQKDSNSSRMSEAKKIHADLQNNSIVWSEAVKQHSEAPTASTGGEIGWIKLSGPMPKEFTESAFKLNLNEISPPVETSFGHHIIKCVEIKPGKLGWKDNIKSVKADAMRYLFDVVVKTHRPQTTIQYKAN